MPFSWSGVIYAGLGDKDEAFRLLEKSYQEDAATLPYLAVDPFWYGLTLSLATPTCCAESGFHNRSDPELVKRYTGRTSKSKLPHQ
jgi:hypothetical protein